MNANAKITATKTIRGVTVNAVPSQRPMLIDGHDTVASLFRARCRANGTRTAHREKDLGIWKSHSWNDFWQHAKWIGLGLRKLGLERGQAVSILSEDRKEWIYTDLGVQCVGGISSGVYTTDSAAQLEYLLTDSGSTFLFVENEEQLDKYIDMPNGAPLVKKVIIYEREDLYDLDDPRFMFIDELYDLGRAAEVENPEWFDAEIDQVKADDVALLIYTSGTTGAPKGAMLTHENIMAGMEAGLYGLPFDAEVEQLCFLPLCHILERNTSIYIPLAVSSTVNFAESPETVFDNIREISPHVFIAVPRVWEKVYSRILIMVQEATGIGKLAFSSAIRAGLKRAEYQLAGQPVPAMVEANFKLWDLLVLSNLRRMIGMDRLRAGVSGAAPISPDLLKWYRAIGVQLLEGYGMTENSGLCSVNLPDANRNGSVGRALEPVGVRIADDGEIQTNGLNSFKGYWGKPDKTAETFTADGWLRTGDVGRLDEDGFLYITGRIKDIIITAGGKNITPAEIESRLKFSHYISDAVVIGDKRKYLTCLIMIDQENVEKYAQDHKVPFSDFASLCRAKAVVDLIAAEVEDVNKQFARVEQLKDFRLIDVLLTAEDDELTATMKLKRAFVEKKYKDLIDQMYQ